jgi:hypothetical protein
MPVAYGSIPLGRSSGAGPSNQVGLGTDRALGPANGPSVSRRPFLDMDLDAEYGRFAEHWPATDPFATSSREVPWRPRNMPMRRARSIGGLATT